MAGMYDIMSNLEAGDGRSDVIMTSRPSPRIVLEFKQGDPVDKLKQKALDQIFEKKYDMELDGKVLCVGLAHNIKQCEWVAQEVMVDAYGNLQA